MYFILTDYGIVDLMIWESITINSQHEALCFYTSKTISIQFIGLAFSFHLTRMPTLCSSGE